MKCNKDRILLVLKSIFAVQGVARDRSAENGRLCERRRQPPPGKKL
jgi:hypothetical protein